MRSKILLIGLCLSFHVFAEAKYRIVPLGVPDGVVFLFPNAVDRDGNVYGYGSWESTRRAIEWKYSVPALLDGFSGSNNDYIFGGNDNGIAVGESNNRACYWQSNVITELPVEGIVDRSTAYAVNQSGVIVGSVRLNFGDEAAAMWTGNTFTIFNGAQSGPATAISDSGIVAGTRAVNGTSRAWRWSNGHSTILPLLGDLLIYGDVICQANGINDQGTIVGAMGRSQAVQRPCYWQGNQVFELPRLPGFTDGYVRTIEGDGTMLGFCITGTTLRAAIWKGGQVFPFSQFVNQSGQGWDFRILFASNPEGYLTGTGYLNGIYTPFVAIPVKDTIQLPGKRVGN